MGLIQFRDKRCLLGGINTTSEEMVMKSMVGQNREWTFQSSQEALPDNDLHLSGTQTFCAAGETSDKFMQYPVKKFQN